MWWSYDDDDGDDDDCDAKVTATEYNESVSSAYSGETFD